MANLWSLSLFSLLPFFFTSNALSADQFSFISSLIQPAETTHCYARVNGDPQSTCFSVSRGIITRLYNGASEESLLGPASTQKGYAYPGLWDGHGHVLEYGQMLHSVKLYGAESIDDVKSRIKEYLTTHSGYGSEAKWIRGIGWDQANFGGIMPTAKELDEDPELKGLFIMLDRVDIHCTWVSESVLALLPDPLPETPGGEIVTSPGRGVFCDNAMDLPLEHWPRPTKEDKMEFLVGAMKSLHSVGIVGVHDAGVVPKDVELYNLMADMGLMTLRVYAMLECPVRNTFCGNITRKIHRDDGMLSVRSVKLFSDGALGSWGAALLEPYTDKPDTSGTMLIEEGPLMDVVKEWYAADYQVNIHAIGDRACRAAIDAFSAVLTSSCPPSDYVSSPSLLKAIQTACILTTQTNEKRLRLEHSQIIHPLDQAKMREMRIIASIQPTHATSDSAYALSRLGEKRLRESAYRMKSLNTSGIPLIFGSDFPVEPPSPFEGMYAAVTRRSPAGNGTWRDGGWYEEESVDVGLALEKFTVMPAWGGFMEGKAGELKVGAWADWVVLDMDILDEATEDAEALRKVRVLETWVGGKRVFCRDCREEEGKWGWKGVKEWGGWWGWAQKVEKVLGEVERILGVQGL